MVDFNIDSIDNFTVVVAADRSKRPKDTFEYNIDSSRYCQFCPGNEHVTPPETYRQAGQTDEWIVRSFPNKFPAFINDDSSHHSGIQEVIVETSNHFLKFEDYSQYQLEAVLDSYENRIKFLKGIPRIKYIVIFKNYGQFSGATLEHPHSQLVGLNFIPDKIKTSNSNLRKFFLGNKNCFYCKTLNNTNIVFQNDSFLCIMPDFARFSFESWIIPKKHNAYYENSTAKQKRDLAEALLKITKATNNLLENPSYNIILNNGTYDGEDIKSYMHWHFQIIPRTSFLAGFEWATGIYIRHVDHKQASAQLQELIRKN